MLIVDWAFAPELAEEAHLWPNMSYNADVSPRGWNSGVSDFGGFERPCRRPGTHGLTASGLTTTGWVISTATDSPITTTCGTG